MTHQWQCLEELDQNIFDKKDPFIVAFDCFSVFSDSKGILIIFSHEEIINIKLSISNESDCPTVKYLGLARLKGIIGSQVVKDKRNSFLVTKDKKIFMFRSFRRIHELPGHSNVKFFECFNSSCYVVLEQIDINFKLKLFSTFESEQDSKCSCCEFDLSFPKDSITVDGSRDNEHFVVEMIQNPFSNKARKFFTEFLACDLQNESIHEILLIAIDDKLMWIKYKNSFQEGAIEGYSIENITSARNCILDVKFNGEYLFILDKLSILTVFYFSVINQMIMKKEIYLEGEVKCFRFYKNYFIYSNLEKIVFMDFRSSFEPTVQCVNLKGIVCFTVVSEFDFLIAICHNRLFYQVPIKLRIAKHEEEKEFEILVDSDIESIPSVVRFFDSEERNLLSIEQEIKEKENLRIFLQNISADQNFNAGEAVIKFHQNFPSELPANNILCKITNQPLGSGFIQIIIQLSKMLAATTFKITFCRHSASGVITRIVKIENSDRNINILIPAEEGDDAANRMELDLIFTHDFKGQTRLMSYPIIIKQIIPFEKSKIKLRNVLDECIEVANKIKM